MAALGDATENALHGWLTQMPRLGAAVPHAAAAGAATLKWLLICGFGALVVHALLSRRKT